MLTPSDPGAASTAPDGSGNRGHGAVTPRSWSRPSLSLFHVGGWLEVPARCPLVSDAAGRSAAGRVGRRSRSTTAVPMQASAAIISRTPPMITPVSEPEPATKSGSRIGPYRAEVGIETRVSRWSAPATSVVFLVESIGTRMTATLGVVVVVSGLLPWIVRCRSRPNRRRGCRRGGLTPGAAAPGTGPKRSRGGRAGRSPRRRTHPFVASGSVRQAGTDAARRTRREVLDPPLNFGAGVRRRGTGTPPGTRATR